MHTLAIDIETYSSVSLPDCGVYRYAESSDFDILLFAYAWDDGPVRQIELACGDTLPQELIDALVDPGIIKTAFNANFERTCLGAYLHTYMPPEQWQCTMVMALELGLPGSLEKVGEALGLSEDKQKLKTGRALIRYFSIPTKDGKRRLPNQDAARWELYCEYNRQDVEAERAIRKTLQRYSIHENEWALWALDQRINDRGVKIDRIFVEQAVAADDLNKETMLRRSQELTGLANPNSLVQLKAWLKNVTGVSVLSLDKTAMANVKEQLKDYPAAIEALELRSRLSKTSTEKYKAMMRASCADDRVRGLSQFYGANRTGRWAGRLVQMQNLPQNKIADLDVARQAVIHGCLDEFYDDVAGTLSQLIRTAFIPKDGYKYIVSDFSAIEARVIAWLAGETWRQEVFANNGDIYCASASQMFHVPVEKHGANSHLRQKGKIAELALGFGGAVGALIRMGALDMGIPEDELPSIVSSWRKASPRITRFWWSVGDAFEQVVKTGHQMFLPHGIAMRKEGPILRLRLPSGRELSYVKPMINGGNITYDGVIQTTGQWGRIETYGPKIVENIVQATARDCLALSIQRLETKGLHTVFHVHDEVIIEAPRTIQSEDVASIMGEPIPWAPGLLLRAEAFECSYYQKD